MSMFGRIGDHYTDWKNEHIKMGVQIARHSMSATYVMEFDQPTRLERKVIRIFKKKYIQREIRWVHRDLKKRQAFALRLAAREGYEKAGTDIPELVAYLEKIGLDEADPLSAVEDAIRIMTGFQDRNTALEAAYAELKTENRDLTDKLVDARQDARDAHQKVWQVNAENSTLKGQIAGAVYDQESAQVLKFRGVMTEAVETV